MSDAPSTVGIVVDPEFGDRLDAFAADRPVWLADTPTNRRSAERLWRERLSPSHTAAGAVTTFVVDRALGPETWCVQILGVVDGHHDGYSQLPPYSAVEVVGAAPSPEVCAALAAIGLPVVEPMATGFRAHRRIAP